MLLDVEEKGIIELDAFVTGPGFIATTCVTLRDLEPRGRSEAHRCGTLRELAYSRRMVWKEIFTLVDLQSLPQDITQPQRGLEKFL